MTLEEELERTVIMLVEKHGLDGAIETVRHKIAEGKANNENVDMWELILEVLEATPVQ